MNIGYYVGNIFFGQEEEIKFRNSRASAAPVGSSNSLFGAALAELELSQ